MIVVTKDIAALRRVAAGRIDAAAEALRLRYMTGGAGQAMVYQAKAAEALRLSGDADPSPAGYPLLAAEVGITAPTLTGVGAAVLAAHDEWTRIGALIEAARLAAKAAIAAAGDPAAVAAAEAAADWSAVQ